MPSQKVLQQKKAIVDNVSSKLSKSISGVVVSYKGINVESDTKLRRELREAGVDYFVIKNTLLSRAAKDAGIDGLDSVLKGTTALAISDNDYSAPARILSNFAKDNKFFQIKSGFIDGRVASQDEIRELAELPSKEVLVAKALGGLNAPIANFANVLNGTLRGLVVALNAIAEKKSA